MPTTSAVSRRDMVGSPGAEAETANRSDQPNSYEEMRGGPRNNEQGALGIRSDGYSTPLACDAFRSDQRFPWCRRLACCLQASRLHHGVETVSYPTSSLIGVAPLSTMRI